VGCLVLALICVIAYGLLRSAALHTQSDSLSQVTSALADNVDRLLMQKSQTALVMSTAPVLVQSLVQDNQRFSSMEPDQRQERIKALNQRWMDTDDPNDSFIQAYLNNPAADYLTHQTKVLPGEYGEIFLTNRYGVLLASTGKLTTLAHAHKSWWKGCYQEGKGSIYFDDRGFDESVGGYVLGLVVPVHHQGEVIGVLKCNLNILGSISRTIETVRADHRHNHDLVLHMLIRDGGAIIYAQGIKPLSALAPRDVTQALADSRSGHLLASYRGGRYLVSYSPVMASNESGVGFGGTAKSVDHKGGGRGQKWVVLTLQRMDAVLSSATEATKSIFLSGFLIVLLLAIIALFFGNRITRPVKALTEGADQISRGDFQTRIKVESHDELGDLASAFNSMVAELEHSTTSISNLEREIERREELESQREKTIAELEAALATVRSLRGLLPICANCKKIRDDQGYWRQVEEYLVKHSEAQFSHGICPDCMAKLYPNFLTE